MHHVARPAARENQPEEGFMPEIREKNEAVKKVAELIKDLKYAMMTTVDSDGALHSRPMGTQEREFDGSLYFLADKNSRKIQELSGESRVNLAYGDPSKNHWVSVAGKAHASRDQQKIDELWSPFHKAWFPEGKEDPSITVIRVDVDSVEYWDAPSTKMVQVVGLIKALVTGTEYNPGENQTVDLKSGSVENTKEKNRRGKSHSA
jgi:general stress protein 26